VSTKKQDVVHEPEVSRGDVVSWFDGEGNPLDAVVVEVNEGTLLLHVLEGDFHSVAPFTVKQEPGCWNLKAEEQKEAVK